MYKGYISHPPLTLITLIALITLLRHGGWGSVLAHAFNRRADIVARGLRYTLITGLLG